MAAPRSFEHENISPEDLQRLELCEERIGYRFQNPDRLLEALTHSSIKTFDQPCNERMEFLGDSVLGLVITEFLFNFFGDLTEGDLTQIKSVVVSTNTLAEESRHFEREILVGLEAHPAQAGIDRTRSRASSAAYAIAAWIDSGVSEG